MDFADTWTIRRDQWIGLIEQVFGARVYIPFASEIGLHVDALEWSGVFLPGIDLLVKESCPSMFKGRRRAFCLNDPTGDPYNVNDVVDFDSLVTHEFCHVLQEICRASIDNPPSPKIPAKYTPDIRRMLSLCHDDETADIGIPEFYWHGDDFIRLLIHASHRLEVVGVELCDKEMFNNSYYSLSPLPWYRHRLGNEPAERVHLPMRQAVAGDPPPHFTELWKADQQNHTPEARSHRRKLRAAVALESTR